MISSFFAYSQSTMLFENNPQMYLFFYYLFVLLVILVIMDIIYVSIAFSRNKFGAVWPLRILRSVTSFIVTVLFIPLMGNYFK